MAKIYYNKIKNGAVNPKTGKPWEISDVPLRWREEVRILLI